MKKINIEENKSKIANLLRNDDWEFGNYILYDLCKNNPLHNKSDIVMTKLIFIGRIYAAALERRKNKGDINDDFYKNIATPLIIKSDIDQKIQSLNFKNIDKDNITEILRVHNYLSNLFYKITALKKRSLASKYLHFHNPTLFFIYDSRASMALRKFALNCKDIEKECLNINDVDAEYMRFYIHAFCLKTEIEKLLNHKITPRELDNLLIAVADRKW